MSFYTGFQHKVYYTCMLIKILLLHPTMYILIHFKLSLKITLTLMNHVKIPIFAAAVPLQSVDFLT